MHIRKAVPEDAQAIAEVHVRSIQCGFSGLMPADYLQSLSIAERAASWRERIDGGEAPTIAVSAETAVAGFILSSPTSEDDGAEIRLLYVDPALWSHGYGRALWIEESRRLASQGFANAIVWVLSGNTRARRFYEKLAFEIDPSSSRWFREAHFALPQVRYRQALAAERPLA